MLRTPTNAERERLNRLATRTKTDRLPWLLALAAMSAGSGAALAERPDIVWMKGGHASDVTSVAFSPDGRTLASGSSDDTVEVEWECGATADRDY